jgi:hypothetical protein
MEIEQFTHGIGEYSQYLSPLLNFLDFNFVRQMFKLFNSRFDTWRDTWRDTVSQSHRHSSRSCKWVSFNFPVHAAHQHLKHLQDRRKATGWGAREEGFRRLKFIPFAFLLWATAFSLMRNNRQISGNWQHESTPSVCYSSGVRVHQEYA